MNRERGPIFLVLLFLFLFSVPMTAQESPCSSVEPTTPLFQALEAAQVQMPRLGDLWIPAPSPKTTCQAYTLCSNGCEISCVGPNETSCYSSSTYVTCNGETTNCPYPTCTPLSPCVDPCAYCACRANGGGGYFCYLSHCEA